MRPERRADLATVPPSVGLTVMELQGPVKACNGIILPLHGIVWWDVHNVSDVHIASAAAQLPVHDGNNKAAVIKTLLKMFLPFCLDSKSLQRTAC
jgi:hypothetical protein